MDFVLTKNDGTPYPLAQHRGQVLLIVNTASKCGFTPQYDGLEALYAKYKDRGLVVIGQPSNDFMGQEPGSDGEIAEFCKARFGVTFPLMKKAAVSGKEMIPLYRYLTQESAHRGTIKWNFSKFLIGRDGLVADRFAPTADPQGDDVIAAVEKALAAAPPAAGSATTAR